MSDMTAEERVTQIFNVIDIDLHGAEIRNSVVDQIRQAEAAARLRALKEAAAVAGTLAERPYDSEPEFSCAITIETHIRALIDNPDDSLVHSASVAKRHVESWPKWEQKAMRREVGIKERDRKKWP